MNAVMVTEVVAKHGETCAFTANGQTLGVARRNDDGHWVLKLPNDRVELCADFDAMRHLIIGSLPGGHACFERRRIQVRSSSHSHIAA